MIRHPAQLGTKFWDVETLFPFLDLILDLCKWFALRLAKSILDLQKQLNTKRRPERYFSRVLNHGLYIKTNFIMSADLEMAPGIEGDLVLRYESNGSKHIFGPPWVLRFHRFNISFWDSKRVCR